MDRPRRHHDAVEVDRLVPPASPYFSNDSGVATKTVQWLVTGLPAGAAFRAQVCAIGAQVGPWSDEVLGKAH